MLHHSTDEKNAVLDALERHPIFLSSLLREFQPDRLKWQPAARKWSAHEHACHLQVVHEIFFERLDRMTGDEEDVIIEPYFPHEAHQAGALLELDLEETMTAYGEDRSRLVEKLRSLDESGWARTAQHEEYARYDVFIMGRHLAMHDLFHAYRIEELLLAKN